MVTSKRSYRFIFFILIVSISLILVPLGESLDLPSQASDNAKSSVLSSPPSAAAHRGSSDTSDDSSSDDTSTSPSSSDRKESTSRTETTISSSPIETNDESKSTPVTSSPETRPSVESTTDMESDDANNQKTDHTETDDRSNDSDSETGEDEQVLRDTKDSSSSSSSSRSNTQSSSRRDVVERAVEPVRLEGTSKRPIVVDITSERNPSETHPQENLKVTVDIPADTSIERVTYKSNHPAVEALLKREQFIQKGRYDEETQLTRQVELPSFAPAGNHTIEAAIETRNEDGSRSVQQVNVTASVPQEKGIRGLIQRAVPRLSTDAYMEVFSKVSPRENRFVPDLDNDTRITTKSSTQQSHTAEDLEVLRTETDPRVQRARSDLERKENIFINKTVESYDVTDENETFTVSRVLLSVRAPRSMKNITIVEVIPKEIAEDVSELELYGPVEVVQEDPIVRWNFDYAQKDEEIKIGYSVKGSVNSNQTKTLGSAEQVSGDARFISFLINGGWFIILISGILLLVVLPTSAYVYTKKKRLESYAK